MPRKAAITGTASDYEIYERTPKGRAKNRINTATGEVVSERQYRQFVSEGKAKQEGITLEEARARRLIEGELQPKREKNNPDQPQWVNQEFAIPHSVQKWITTLNTLPFAQAFVNDLARSNPDTPVWIVACGMVREYPINGPKQAGETGVPGCRTLIDLTAAADVAGRWGSEDHQLEQFISIETVWIRFKVPV